MNRFWNMFVWNFGTWHLWADSWTCSYRILELDLDEQVLEYIRIEFWNLTFTFRFEKCSCRILELPLYERVLEHVRVEFWNLTFTCRFWKCSCRILEHDFHESLRRYAKIMKWKWLLHVSHAAAFYRITNITYLTISLLWYVLLPLFLLYVCLLINFARAMSSVIFFVCGCILVTLAYAWPLPTVGIYKTWVK